MKLNLYKFIFIFFLAFPTLTFSKASSQAFERNIVELNEMMSKLSQNGDSKLGKKVINKTFQMEKKFKSPLQVSMILNIRYVAYNIIGKREEAAKAADKLLRKYPKTPAANAFRHMKAWQIFNSKDYKNAVPALKKALKVKQGDPVAEATSHLYLAWSLRETGNKLEAKEHLLKVKKIAEKYPQIEQLRKLEKDADETLKID
ncbi:MAG: tetratricopeptide repeat protein [Bdellovibrionota bacterium]